MIHAGVELHNVAEAVRMPGLDGLRLQRLPDTLRAQVNPSAGANALRMTGCEIRFLTDSSEASITLSAPATACMAQLSFGPFRCGPPIHVAGDEIRTIDLVRPDTIRDLDRRLVPSSFSPSLWRVVFNGGGVHFHGVEADGLRPPGAADVPHRRWLAYGTSITEGGSALNYVSRAAVELDIDPLNLGLSGAAFCEPELADWIAQRADWDVATLEISVNMLGKGVTADQFRETAGEFVSRVAHAHPDKPILCITLLPTMYDLGVELEVLRDIVTSTPHEYREALRDVVNTLALPNVGLIDGPSLLTDIGGLSADLLHPSDAGFIEIGTRLARELRSRSGARARTSFSSSVTRSARARWAVRKHVDQDPEP